MRHALNNNNRRHQRLAIRNRLLRHPSLPIHNRQLRHPNLATAKHHNHSHSHNRNRNPATAVAHHRQCNRAMATVNNNHLRNNHKVRTTTVHRQ
jgi:hypothetical protein